MGQDDAHCFVPGETTQANVCRRRVQRHSGRLRDCLREGVDAGRSAVSRCGFERSDVDAAVHRGRRARQSDCSRFGVCRRTRSRIAVPKQFVDFQNDTSVADIRLAVREGYRNVEHVKRYTALGFGTDQGKLGNINGMAVLARVPGQVDSGGRHDDVPAGLYAGDLRYGRRRKHGRSVRPGAQDRDS